jgi:hypothetical protein
VGEGRGIGKSSSKRGNREKAEWKKKWARRETIERDQALNVALIERDRLERRGRERSGIRCDFNLGKTWGTSWCGVRLTHWLVRFVTRVI